MHARTRRTAFTLIEMLTVMAIITLLIGILTPALGAARDRARTTAVRAQINAMEVGLESFAGENGEYPASNANLMATDINNPGNSPGSIDDWEVSNGSNLLQGAHLLVDAMVGRDFLGYDPKAPGAGAPTTTYNRWDVDNDRQQPYIPTDGVDVTSVNEPPEDAFGPVPMSQFGEPQPIMQDNLLARVFRDRFGWPILYYRANPTARQNTPIIQTDNPPSTFYGDGVYDGLDNAVFTSYLCTDPPDNTVHRICDANVGLAPQVNYGPTLEDDQGGRFAEFIRSFRASTFDATNPDDILQPRPVRSDRFILLSAGKDGVFGTLDDVANFQVLSTER